MGSITRSFANLITANGPSGIPDGTVTNADLAGSISTDKLAGKINFKNLVINGDISVWQRGTSFTNVNSGDFTADRWCMSYRAIGNADIAQVDNKTYKSLKVTNSNGSSQEIVMRYRVEDVTQFNNNSFVLSFYAKASTSVTLDTRVYENYGSGGSATVTLVDVASQNKTITTSRQRFTISFTTSDMSSKTIGSSNYLQFSFHPTLVSGANWEFDSVQLEAGTTASDFEFLPYDVNLQRCQRYFYRNPNNSGGAGFIYTSHPMFNIELPVTMRVNPSCTVSDGSAITSTNAYGQVTYTSPTSTSFNTRTNSVRLLYAGGTWNSSITYGLGVIGYPTDLLVSAEL